MANHLAILVQDRVAVDAVERKMRNNGFRVLFPCEEHPELEPRYYAVVFCHPDNYVIKIYTRAEAKHSSPVSALD